MISEIIIHLSICLICTIIIETLVALLLKINKTKDIINIILVNIMTNPVLNSLYLLFEYKLPKDYIIISLIVMELLVFIIEGTIYKKYLSYKKLNPYIISLILNISSYTIGLLISKIITI